MKTLHASNPGEVASASSIKVLLADGEISLMIFSGIAIPELRVNHDSQVYSDEVIVKLGVNAGALVKAVSHVGLASISNDETAFTFATNAGTVEVEPSTGELQLRVSTALRGEKTYLHRFGYQVVAHVRIVSARIAGTIRVPRNILDLKRLAPDDVPAQFIISANRVEQIPPSSAYSFAMEKVIPVAWGQTGAVRCDESTCFVDYVIDGCPFNMPLRINVDTAATLASKSAVCGQMSGPRPVTLTNAVPSIEGVDFSISQLIVR